MSSSLIRYSTRVGSGGKRLFWGRADLDGFPFRGPSAPSMPEEEYAARVVRVADARNAFFDVTVEGENRQYLDVMECCFNGWFRLVFIDRFWKGTTKHYVEWVEYYMEDGARTPYSPNTLVELSSGQQNFLGGS